MTSTSGRSRPRGGGCRLEINAAPDRLDLDDVHLHAAKEAKTLIAISTDARAHFPRVDALWPRPGAPRLDREGDVVNTLPLSKLKKSLRR